ncbi:MAG TPA: hypothetical protein VN131_04315 [Mobilitalea sp.]|nr:hypothetical protein [Mobilitalea sp.]
MMQLLVLRERVKNFYQRNDIYIRPIIKFIFAFIVFQTINSQIGYDTRFKSLPVVLLLSLLSAFMPSAIMVLLAAIVSALHVYSMSPILSIIIILILLILYLLFARFTPRLGYVLLAVPILYVLKIPYVIPILLGLVAGPIAIIPTGCGVVIYFVFQVIKAAIQESNSSVEDILQNYTFVIDNLMKNKLMIMTIIVFSLVLLVTYFARRMKYDYAFEIAIAAGALTSILGFLVSDMIFDQTGQILTMILGTVVSAGIVYAIHFFELTLDYSGVEHAQFEDDVYYYYVKAVPKITVTTPQMNVKRINGKNVEQVSNTGALKHDVDSEDYDEDDDLYSDSNDDYNFRSDVKVDKNKGADK